MDAIIRIAKQALILTLLISGPPVVVCASVGLIISIIQTMVQIQEQAFAFMMKLVATMATLFIIGGWLGSAIIGFSNDIFQNLRTYI